MSVLEKVEFCERCSRAFDIPVNVYRTICDECKTERRLDYKRQYNRRRRPPRGPAWRIPPPEPWMLERRRQGCTYAQIAQEAGIPKSSVYRRFQKFS